MLNQSPGSLSSPILLALFRHFRFSIRPLLASIIFPAVSRGNGEISFSVSIIFVFCLEMSGPLANFLWSSQDFVNNLTQQAIEPAVSEVRT